MASTTGGVVMTFTLRSSAFTDGERIPTHSTCEGRDQSPALRWDGAPTGTQSFALIVDDPDAPHGTFTHWVLFDIPASERELAEGQPVVGIAGINDFQRPGYNGPCPPERHGEHRYVFTLYALDMPTLGLGQTATRREVEGAMQDHILAQAQLTGRYAREAQKQRGA
jgi:Raf kinase inhibitor-like YbhB/YbcL family protein